MGAWKLTWKTTEKRRRRMRMRNKSSAARAFLSYYYRVQQQQLEKMIKCLSGFSVVFYLNSYIFHEWKKKQKKNKNDKKSFVM